MLKRLMAMVVISGFALSSASAEMSLEEKEKKILTTYVTSLATMYGAGKQSVEYNFPDLPRPQLKVSAQSVADEFDDNQLHAEKLYSRKVLLVEGKVSKIKNTSYAGLIVWLDTTTFEHGDSQAYMHQAMADVLADYKVGQDISLICSGGAIYDLIPTYKNCIVRSEVKREAAKVAEKVADAFLKGQDINAIMQTAKGALPAPIFLYTIKYVSHLAPENPACLEYATFKQCDMLKYMPENIGNTPEFKKVYNKDREFFRLPELTYEE